MGRRRAKRIVKRLNPWLLVALLWVVAVLNYVDRQAIFSVFPLLEAELKVPAVQLGLLTTVFAWVYGLVSPFAGYVADRFGRVRMILLSLLVWSVVTWLTGHAGNIGQLLGSRALMGISEACYIPAALALIADYHGARTRSLATGLHQSGLYIGVIIGGAGGGWLGQHFGWRPAFTLMGVVGIAYFLILKLALRGTDVPKKATTQNKPIGATIKELLHLPGFLPLATVFSTVALANWIAYTWLPLYLYETFGMSLAEAGFSATFYMQAGSFAGILAGGWLADFWTIRSSRGRLSTQMTGLLLMAPFLFSVGFVRGHYLLLAALFLFGFGRGLYDCNTMPTLCDIAPPEIRSTGYGIFNLMSCLAGGAATAAAGYLKGTIGLSGSFEITAVLLLLSCILLSKVRVL
jgi:MFS transporter, Spinster family, sphingosine-1-phosphate transporter